MTELQQLEFILDHKKALDRQEGGNHYKDMPIQPVEFIMANNLSWCVANIIKYACRHDKKGQAITDLDKVIHYAQILKESLNK